MHHTCIKIKKNTVNVVAAGEWNTIVGFQNIKKNSRDMTLDFTFILSVGIGMKRMLVWERPCTLSKPAI